MTRSPFPGGPAARLAIRVDVWRGQVLESRHHVQAAVSDARGELRASTSSPEETTTFRSAAKPFQLLPLVERGHADRLGFSEEQLAVMAASHTGSAYHVGLVQGILQGLGLSDRDLACAFHEPLDGPARAALRVRPEGRSKLYNNCSGKHAGMLALARCEGWPTEGYERADHPLQRLMLETVADLCGMRPQDVPTGVDGCGVPVFGVPIRAMAMSYARLASAAESGDPRSAALARIRQAMMRHPVTTGGAERFSTAFMQAAPHVVSKGGAEGLECVGIVDARGLGVAVKCEDGQSRAVGPAVIALLEHLELLDPAAPGLDAWRRPVVRNYAGLDVGELRASVEPMLEPTGSPMGSPTGSRAVATATRAD